MIFEKKNDSNILLIFGAESKMRYKVENFGKINLNISLIF